MESFHCHCCTARYNWGYETITPNQKELFSFDEEMLSIGWSLIGTRTDEVALEGLCTFCRTAVAEDAGITEMPQKGWDRQSGMLSAPPHCNKWAWAKRTAIMAAVTNPEAYSLLEGLLLDGIMYAPFGCKHPHCNNVVAWDLPQRGADRLCLCEDHEHMDLRETCEGPLNQRIFMSKMDGHDFMRCSCQSCKDIYRDASTQQTEDVLMEEWEGGFMA